MARNRGISKTILLAFILLANISAPVASFATSPATSGAGVDCRALFRSTDVERFFVRSAQAVRSERTSEVTFADLARDTERFERFIPRVYARIGSKKLPDELATLATYLDRFGGHALSVGNYGAIDGLPAIDAVHFPRDAQQPPINVSIKSSTNRDRTNAFVFINSAMSKARRSLRVNYGRVALTHFLGAKLENAEDIFSVLGFNSDRDRPAMLVLDLSLEVTQVAKLERAERDPHYLLPKEEYPTDILLTVQDRRVSDAENESFDRMNLSALQREIRASIRATKRFGTFGRGSQFSEYRIMFADATLIVSAQEIRLTPR